MAVQSNAELHLLIGLLPASSVFDPSFQFLILRLLICFYTAPPSGFWSSSYSTSLRIIVKYLTYIPSTIHSINMTSPLEPTYSDKWKYI